MAATVNAPPKASFKKMASSDSHFKVFWDRYSDRPDTNSMMLNNSAEELESSDRADILASLPLVQNKDVVDIGAGIGRFTTVLAETARWVLSTDFIESFMAKNRERNAHLGNVNYQVGDAVNLTMQPTSVDLVFTNWLMMYMSDHEVVEFIFKCIEWLRPYGFVHLRESCSEPSTGRTKGNTMHSTDTANPTHYRFSSLYIQLLRNIRFRDDDGKMWKFNVHWSCSVPTYIKRQNNWRQVHWLTQKVPAADSDKETTFNDMLEAFSTTWKQEQEAWDAKLDNEKFVWTDKIFAKSLVDGTVEKDATVFVHTPRKLSPYLHVNSHLLAEKFNCNVWNAENTPYYYRTSLTKANQVKDQRVRFGWNESLSSSVDYWQKKDAAFDVVVATELTASKPQEIEQLTKIITRDGRLVTLEPVSPPDVDVPKTKLEAAGFRDVVVEDVSNEARSAMDEYFKAHEHLQAETSEEKRWLLITARV